MSRPYDERGLKRILVSQALAASLLMLMTPVNMLAAKYDSDGVIGNLHMAVWSISTVGWICVLACMIRGLAQMRDCSVWFCRAHRMMLFLIAGMLAGSACFVAAVLLGPMQMREGIEELEASYQTYWLFGVLCVLAGGFFLLELVLGVLFNRQFLWGLAGIFEKLGGRRQAVMCKLLFSLGIITLIGGMVALVFYYYQALNSTVDSKAMSSARFCLLLMGGLWAVTQFGVIGMTWLSWRRLHFEARSGIMSARIDRIRRKQYE